VADPNVKFEQVSVVLLGSFNPQIFQPAWLASEGLIRKEEAESAKIQVIHPEATGFSLEWASLEVTHERFRLETSTDQRFSPELVRDLVLGLFQLLSHTPVKQMGINRIFHFQIESEEKWHTIGHRLVPKDDWAGILERPGMRVVAVEGVRPDQYKGRITVQLEPSVRFRYGVFAAVNDHFEKKQEDSREGAIAMVEILKNDWQESLDRSKRIIYTLMSKIT
jgi:hypothetical protein